MESSFKKEKFFWSFTGFPAPIPICPYKPHYVYRSGNGSKCILKSSPTKKCKHFIVTIEEFGVFISLMYQ